MCNCYTRSILSDLEIFPFSVKSFTFSEIASPSMTNTSKRRPSFKVNIAPEAFTADHTLRVHEAALMKDTPDLMAGVRKQKRGWCRFLANKTDAYERSPRNRVYFRRHCSPILRRSLGDHEEKRNPLSFSESGLLLTLPCQTVPHLAKPYHTGPDLTIPGQTIPDRTEPHRIQDCRSNRAKIRRLAETSITKRS